MGCEIACHQRHLDWLCPGMYDFHRFPVDVGDERIHPGTGTEFSLFDEIDRVFYWTTVWCDEEWFVRLFDEV